VTVTAVGNIATFNNLSIDRSAVNYRITAEVTSGPFAGITGESQEFDITPGPADHLAFAVEPTTTDATVTITPAVAVAVQDVLDNTVVGFVGNVSVGFGTDPTAGAAILAGTTTQVVTQGLATFPDLSIDVAATGYTLEATTSGLTAATSAAFEITAGTASHLLFTQQPTDATAGVTIAPAVQVMALDGMGNTLTGFNGDVTVTITAGTAPPGTMLFGTTTVAAVNGVATFSDLSMQRQGTQRLSATAAGFSGATSSTFTINAGAAAVLDFRSHPANTEAGQTIPAFTVRAKDVFGNVADTFTGDISVAISVNPGEGTLSGTTTVAAVAGAATFTGLSIDKSGSGYRLETTSVGLAPDVSNSFIITPGPADHFLFTVAPSDAAAGVNLSPAVQVTAFDALDNIATGFTGLVTLAITPGTGTAGATLAGTTSMAAVSGTATFGAINVTLAGTAYRLTATAPGVTEATSTTFDITP